MSSRVFAFLALFGASVLAAPINTTPAIAAAGGGQHVLAVAFDAQGQLRARVCDHVPCDATGALVIPVPKDMAGLAATARLQVVRLGLERKAIVVEMRDPASLRGFEAIVAAPLSGSAPVVPFSGYTGLIEGEDGERRGPMVLVRPEGVYVGVEEEGRNLCGRPAILSPEALDPRTLTLKSAKVQRLDETERARAPVLLAKRVDTPAPPPLLHAVWATSAAPGSPASALSDGDPTTAWFEDRGGAGRGEFVVLGAPEELPATAFEIAVPRRQAPHDGVPSELWLVTDHELFHVRLPDDAGRTASERYEATLPAPVRTSCVALVLEATKSEDRDVRVGVSELSMRPAVGGTPEELVHALASGGSDAEAAGAVLRASGPAGFATVAAAFPTLDEGGRRVALDVLDDAPCAVALPVYVKAFIGPYDAQRLHARDAFVRCPNLAPTAIADALVHGSATERLALAEELSDLSPSTAVKALVPLLAASDAATRRAYRVAIGRSSDSNDARAAVSLALDDATLAPLAELDLLRALGERLPPYGASAEHAFARLATGKLPFRTRYLLLGPAAMLAKDDGGARAFLRDALVKDASAYVRSEAARSLRDPTPFYAELSRALDDPDVRVRQAAAAALGRGGLNGARERLVYVLKHDPWPLVRVAAARALAGLSPAPETEVALGDALEDDDAPDVRRAALGSIGALHAVSDTRRVRARLDDEDEVPAVRAAAALALGLVCDVGSVDRLTTYARRLQSRSDQQSDNDIGRNAVLALEAIHPPDLERRLAPLRGAGVPPPVRALADSAVRSEGRCAAPARPR